MLFQIRQESLYIERDPPEYGEAVQTVKSILRAGGRRRTLAPGPEKVDEEWQLSKDSADAATAKRTAADRQVDGRPETDRLLRTDL